MTANFRFGVAAFPTAMKSRTGDSAPSSVPNAGGYTRYSEHANNLDFCGRRAAQYNERICGRFFHGGPYVIVEYQLHAIWRLRNPPERPCSFSFYWRFSSSGNETIYEAAEILKNALDSGSSWWNSLSNCLPISSFMSSLEIRDLGKGAVGTWPLQPTDFHGTRITLFANGVPLSVQARVLWIPEDSKRLGYTQIPFLTSNDVENERVIMFTWASLQAFANVHASDLVGGGGQLLQPSIAIFGQGLRPIVVARALTTLSRQLHRRK